MATIVQYSSSRKPLNAYPKRIISPLRPRRCCSDHMVHVGKMQEDERGFRFYYRRCNVCGFSLRHFLPFVPPEQAPPIHRQQRLPLEVEEVA